MSLELTDPHRRALLLAAAAAVSCEFVTPPRAAGQAPPGNGAVGDFNFLAGSWKIRHRRLKTGGTAPVWDEFDGEATCVTVLGGAGSIEELRIPARDFSGLGIRLLDPATRLWADYWVNGKERVIGAPGLTGSFHEGAGIFVAEDVEGTTPIKARAVWDRITPTSCRWHQSTSRDGGKTWEENWNMIWTRVGR